MPEFSQQLVSVTAVPVPASLPCADQDQLSMPRDLRAASFSYDGQQILLNSAKGRVKDKNMRARPHVALSILDPDNAYRYIQIIGDITEITEQGGDAHIDPLAKKYLGQDSYPFRQPGEVPVIYQVTPGKIQTMG